MVNHKVIVNHLSAQNNQNKETYKNIDLLLLNYLKYIIKHKISYGPQYIYVLKIKTVKKF